MSQKPHHLKSYLLLLILNSCIFLSFIQVFSWHYSLPLIFILTCSNIYLCFFYKNRILKLVKAEKIKSYKSKNKNIHVYTGDFMGVFAISHPTQLAIVFSTQIFKILTKEERDLIVNYYEVFFKTGWLFFFSITSAFLEIFYKILPKKLYFYLLNWILKSLKNVVLKIDARDKKMSHHLAYLLWKIEEIYSMELEASLYFLNLLYFSNSLTSSQAKCYTPTELRVKHRVQALIGYYPPFRV